MSSHASLASQRPRRTHLKKRSRRELTSSSPPTDTRRGQPRRAPPPRLPRAARTAVQRAASLARGRPPRPSSRTPSGRTARRRRSRAPSPSPATRSPETPPGRSPLDHPHGGLVGGRVSGSTPREATASVRAARRGCGSRGGGRFPSQRASRVRPRKNGGERFSRVRLRASRRREKMEKEETRAPPGRRSASLELEKKELSSAAGEAEASAAAQWEGEGGARRGTSTSEVSAARAGAQLVFGTPSGTPEPRRAPARAQLGEARRGLPVGPPPRPNLFFRVLRPSRDQRTARPCANENASSASSSSAATAARSSTNDDVRVLFPRGARWKNLPRSFVSLASRKERPANGRLASPGRRRRFRRGEKSSSSETEDAAPGRACRSRRTRLFQSRSPAFCRLSRRGFAHHRALRAPRADARAPARHGDDVCFFFPFFFFSFFRAARFGRGVFPTRPCPSDTAAARAARASSPGSPP